MAKKIKKLTKNDKKVTQTDTKLTGTANDFLDKTNHTPEAEMVRKAYNDIDCLYGIYSPDYYHIATRILFGLMVTLLDALVIAFIVFLLVTYPSIGLYIGAITVGLAINCFFFYAYIALNCKIHKIYFYKHNGKVVTVHYHKYFKYLVICLEKDKFYCYNFKKDSWKESRRKIVALETWVIRKTFGSYLLFPYIFEDNARKNGKFVTVKNKIKVYGKNKNKTKIISEYKNSQRHLERRNKWKRTKYMFKDGNLQYIEFRNSILNVNGSPGTFIQYMRIYETNVVHCMEIPKSFIDFCKSQGIEPPEECEHLHYV